MIINRILRPLKSTISWVSCFANGKKNLKSRNGQASGGLGSEVSVGWGGVRSREGWGGDLWQKIGDKKENVWKIVQKIVWDMERDKTGG